MQISVTDAKAQLTDLVRRAEAGDEIVLTRHGHPAVKLVPIRAKLSKDERLKLIREIQRSAAERALPGPDAARSADFLYNDETGLPE